MVGNKMVSLQFSPLFYGLLRGKRFNGRFNGFMILIHGNKMVSPVSFSTISRVSTMINFNVRVYDFDKNEKVLIAG